MKKFYFLVLLFVCQISNSQTFVKNFNELISIVPAGGDDAYFVADDGVHGFELWKTDGSKENTYLVKDINTMTSSDPSILTMYNDEVYFVADDGVFGEELWKSDGTEEGTLMVKNLTTTIGVGSYISNLMVFNGSLYFTASTIYAGGGRQIWKTDGTEEGTIKVYDGGSHNIGRLIQANGTLYFQGFSESNSFYELRNDSEVIPIEIDEFYSSRFVGSFNDQLYFTTTQTDKIRLYTMKSDNVPILLQEYEVNGGHLVQNFTKAGSYVYYTYITHSNTAELDQLWRTDGTAEGTIMLKSQDDSSHIANSEMRSFVEYKDQLYYNSGIINEYALWKSDGTPEGTKQAVDIPLNYIMNMIVHDGLLYFYSNVDLWSSDGTIANTTKVSKLEMPRRNTGEYLLIQSSGEKLYFKSKYQVEKALTRIERNPLVKISEPGREILSGEKIYMETKLDSAIKKRISIYNFGTKDLVFSKIKVEGEDFYVNGNLDVNDSETFKQQIEPGKVQYFDVYFFPSSKGMKRATVTIESNEVKNPLYTFYIDANADDEIGASALSDIELDKEIQFENNNAEIVLDNNSIPEDAPVGSFVGNLLLNSGNTNISYRLSQSDIYVDNAYFKIEQGKLETAKELNYELKNTFVLHVSAFDESGTEMYSDKLYVELKDIVEQIDLGDCETSYSQMASALYGIDFFDDDLVVAVGSDGLILKSNDGGETWDKVHSENLNNLKKVQFTEPSVGYAVGRNLLKTVDGGNSWFTIDLPEEIAYYANRIFFLDSDYGFVFNNDGKIYKTEDGGKYWKKNRLGDSNLKYAFFLDREVGYIATDASIYKTTDGGDTWKNTSEKFSVLDYGERLGRLVFLNETTGLMLTSFGQVLKSTDAGESWQVFSALDSNLTVLDMYAIDENNIYVLTSTGVYKSTDGGVTWNLDYDYSLGRYANFDFSPDGKKSIVVNDNYTGFYNRGSGIVIKEEGKPVESISDLHLYGETQSLIMDQDIQLIFDRSIASRSYDEGLTWERINLPSDKVVQAKYYDNKIYLTDIDKMYQSLDHGDTWEVLSEIKLRRFVKIDDQTLIGASYGWGIYKSTDDGRTWRSIFEQPVAEELPGYNIEVFFKNNTEGYVGTVNDGMFKTLDGGDTWQKVDLETEGDLLNVYSIYIKGELGFASSSQGVFKTTDGGDTWFKSYLNIGYYALDIYSKSESEWYMVTRNYILKSVDAGQTFQKIASISVDSGEFEELNGKVYVAGDDDLFVELTQKANKPQATFLVGNTYVQVNEEASFSTQNILTTSYVWEAEGASEFHYRGSQATATWDTPGEYKIKVIPSNGCYTGESQELKVTVVNDQDYAVDISGDLVVDEYSLDNLYTITPIEGKKVTWFIEGALKFSSDGNDVLVDWGQKGVGQVKAVVTDEVTGVRKTATVEVLKEKKVFPPDNIKVQVLSESCPDENNGSIIIETKENYNYHVVVNGQHYEFNDSITLDSLHPGLYGFCVSVSEISYSQCYTVEVKSSEEILGRSKVDAEKSKVNFTIDKGTAPYKAYINGELVLTSSARDITLDVRQDDIVEVKSAKYCEGSLISEVDFGLNGTTLKVYPNPVKDNFSVKLPNDTKEIEVTLYTSNMSAISSSKETVVNGRVDLSLGDQPKGIYFLKVVMSNRPVIVKILKI